MSEATLDAIVVGGGHNGLVAAAYLARAGLKPLVLERRPILGGVAVTEEIFPGFRVDTVLHDAGTLRPQIVRDLFLKMHGLETLPSGNGDRPLVFAPLPDGRSLSLWPDNHRSAGSLRHFSARDAFRLADYRQMISRYAAFLESALAHIPPNLTRLDAAAVFPWLAVGRDFKGLGGRDMYGLLRLLPMSLTELLEEWFENDFIRAVLGAPGVTAIRQGPRSAGTAFVLLYHHLGHRQDGLPAALQLRGGVGALAASLERAVISLGGAVRANAPVSQILLRDGRAVGVRLADGQEIAARVVLSGASPRHTFTGLVDPYELDPSFVRALDHVKYRGAVARVNLALAGLPRFSAVPDGEESALAGRIHVGPSLEYLERAYDAAKYGRFSSQPYLDVRIQSLSDPSLAPPGRHVMSIWAQYAPHELRHATWDNQRQALGDAVLATLAEYAPDVASLILHRQVLTPADLAETYGLAEGAIYHGELMLDQLFFMRPAPGWAQYRSPIAGLYLCGAGAHPGGGITGEPGRLAAQAVLQDWRSP